MKEEKEVFTILNANIKFKEIEYNCYLRGFEKRKVETCEAGNHIDIITKFKRSPQLSPKLK